MLTFENAVTDFFKALQDEVKISLFTSQISLQMEGTRGAFEAFYAFYQNGAVRLEVKGEDILGVSIWTRPGSLEKPNLFVDLSRVDAFAEVDTIAQSMRGGGDSLMRDQGDGFFESVLPEGASERNVGEFMASIGPFAYDKKLSSLYDSFEVWAEVNSKEILGKPYFLALAKNWLIRNGKGGYSDLEVKKATTEDSTVVNTAQEDMFNDEIFQNQAYYKVIMVETALRQIAEDDPLINGVYICGGPGQIRREIVKKALQDAEVWDQKVAWKSGLVRGIGSLMDVLWKNKKSRILVLEDVDGLLKKNRGKSRDLLLTVLKTEDPSRMVSYTRIKRDDDDK